MIRVEKIELPHLCYTKDSPRARNYLYKKIVALVKSGDVTMLRSEGTLKKGGTYTLILACHKVNGIVTINAVRGLVDSVMIS